jgi:hypothetical protein
MPDPIDPAMAAALRMERDERTAEAQRRAEFERTKLIPWTPTDRTRTMIQDTIAATKVPSEPVFYKRRRSRLIPRRPALVGWVLASQEGREVYEDHVSTWNTPTVVLGEDGMLYRSGNEPFDVLAWEDLVGTEDALAKLLLPLWPR